MSKEEIKNEAMKKEIGLRFKEFRKAIKKTRYELADELKVHQSTITHIETGKNFPVWNIQHYLHNQYNLNINWLFNESEEMIISPAKNSKYADLPLLFKHIRESDPMFEQYVELIRLMRVPLVEQIILGKLAEIKVLAQEEIKSFFDGS